MRTAVDVYLSVQFFCFSVVFAVYSMAFFNNFMFIILYWTSNTLFLIQSSSGLLGEFVLFLIIPILLFFLVKMVTRLGVLLTPFFGVVWEVVSSRERRGTVIPPALPVSTEHVVSFWLTPLHFKAQ